MNEKIFGNVLIGKTILGVIAYTILSASAIFIIKFTYTLLFMKMGFNIKIFDFALWITLVILISIFANKIILIFKLENVKVFSRLTIFVALFLLYIYYYVDVFVYSFDLDKIILPHKINEVFSMFDIIFSEEVILSGKRGTSITLPSFLNYIFMLFVAISFLIPRGEFLLEKWIYINGVKVEFKKYYLFSNSEIDESSLKSKDIVYLMKKSDLKRESLIKGEYYTLFISRSLENSVYVLVKNGFKEKNGKLSLTLHDTSKYYYKANQSIKSFINKTQRYNELVK